MSSQQEEEEDPYTERRYTEYFRQDDEQSRHQSTPAASTSSGNRSSARGSSSSTQRQTQQSNRASSSSARQTQQPFFATMRRVTSLIDDEEEEEEEALHSPLGAEQHEDRATEEEPLFGVGSDDRHYRRTPFDDRHQEGLGAADMQDEDDDTDSFYALLNVQKDASEEQIRDAYRALAVSLHPDKHSSPSLKTAAEHRFLAVQRAYEVLTDTEKRSIYDHFGARGLAGDWSLVRRANMGGPRSAAEMRQMWERLARFDRQRKAEERANTVRSKGEFVVHVDASSMLCPDEHVPRSKDVIRMIGQSIMRQEEKTGKPFEDGDTLEIELPDVTLAERWSGVGCTSLAGKHGWELPLTESSRLLVNGQLAIKGGLGGGNITSTMKTYWNSKLSTEASISMLEPRIGTLKGQYQLTKFSFISFMATGSSFLLPPQLHLSFGQLLSKSSPLTGFTTFNSGTYTIGSWGKGVRVRKQAPNMTFGMSNRYGDGKAWTWQVSLESSSVEYSFRPAILGSPKLRLGFTLGLRNGVNAFHMVERKITENIKLGLGLFFSIPLGSVTLQLRFSRLGQKVLMPIRLSPEYRPDIIAACTLLPGLGLLAAEHWYFRPSRRQKVQDRLADLRSQHKELIRQRRRAAREAVDVLRKNAFRRAHAERNAGGLVVIQAYYGKRDSCPPLNADEEALGSADELFCRVWGETIELGERLSSANALLTSLDLMTEVGEQREDEKAWCDVTVPVMMLVQRGQLIILGGRQKHKLLGFYDPCMGERKHLIVRYLFRERLHQVIVDDVTQLTAPLRSHAS